MAAFEMPSLMGIRGRSFKPAHAQQLSAVGTQGFIQTINRTSPFWVAEYTTAPLAAENWNEAITFLDSLEGAMNSFLAYDPKRVMPFAYKEQAVGAAPWGTPSISGFNYAASTLNITGFISGRTVTKGDYISAQIDGVWYLFRSMQTRSTGGGAIADLIVRPRPNIMNFTATLIRYQRACAEMKMIGGYSEEDSVEGFPTLSFRASQFANRAGG